MRRMMIIGAFALLAPLQPAALAQTADPPRLQLLGQLTSASSGEFSGNDVGVGGLLAWRALPLLAVDGEMNSYARSLTVNGGSPFSRGRVEALVGISAGPDFGYWRPFGSFRTGVVKYQSAPGPVACPAIFPPLLSCVLAGGEAVIVQEIGGGFEAFPVPRAVVRLELGSRLTHYPGSVIGSKGALHNAPFYEGEFRFAIGAGVRF